MSDLNISSAGPSASQQPAQHAAEAKISENLVESAPKTAEFSQRYSSPRGTVDPESGVYVLQIRDGESGAVKNQYPSEKVVAEYEKTASIAQDTSQTAKASSAPISSDVVSVSSSVEPVATPAPSAKVDAPAPAPAPSTSENTPA